MTRPIRTPVTVQQAEGVIRRVAADARAVAVVLDSFMASSSIPDPVVVSLALRSRSLLQEATEHLDAALQRLEVA